MEAACAEIGVAYDIVDLDARNSEHRGDTYSLKNPHRKMPTLETEDGEIITESVAILLALDERHPEAQLLPPFGTKDRAQALRWMIFLGTELYPLIEMIDYPERFAESGKSADDLRVRAEGMLKERWKIVESNIAGSPYCVATGFSATDLFLVKLSVWLDEGWRREHLPKIEVIINKVRERPSLAEVWARHIR